MGRAARLPTLCAFLTAASAGLLLAACSETPVTPTDLCTRVLLEAFPDAKLRATPSAPRPHSPRLLFEAAPREGFPGVGRFACETQRSLHGTLRLRSARLDERPLSDAELALINAELLLEDIRAAEPDPDRPARPAVSMGPDSPEPLS